MIFRKGDKLTLRSLDGDDEFMYEYVVLYEMNNHIVTRSLEPDGSHGQVLLNKSSVTKRIGISWTHQRQEILPEELFTL